MDHGGRGERKETSQYLATYGTRQIAGNMMVFRKRTRQSETRWHRGEGFDPSLTESDGFLSGAGLLRTGAGAESGKETI